uniref:glutamate formimidoyltransferase n=1 Tax=uncultured marine group II/III euryarchaeote KM3_28_D12 TaxID=1456431 RepID=A0A075GWY2_9EURY|nr:glutamate formiminotransferase (FTCD) [uncultured marine group II/III euryarchaeote KM3_28_D12]
MQLVMPHLASTVEMVTIISHTPPGEAMQPLVECVPNFSEGRDDTVIDDIVKSASGIDGCRVLSSEPDADYNRTVVTIAGNPEAVSEAAFRLISRAKELIDMRQHQGEHPRIGAVDVCPFIPLRDSTFAECATLANSLATRVAGELNVPVFLYGHAASIPERRVLSDLRRGQYEGLQERLSDGDSNHGEETRYPDLGPQEWGDAVARFGAVVIGARPILVAYNVNLDEKDARVAKLCGSIVRSSGRLIKGDDGRKMRVRGMLDKVQGMGVPLESHGISQVSMNLIDVSVTDMHDAYECIKTVVSDHDVEVCGSELVGLTPLSSMLNAGRWYHESPEHASDEQLVQAAINGLGLDQLGPFDANQRIIEWAAEAK